ncbi:hypothetical protein FGE12_14420 [Aggregicoccus sp. 17bor-14]|uniref:hypothetical protein n=1 Tax=Myxococcaceae TaxID=31 RepID=UPI00129CD929|nr:MULTISPECIES: hypothetical protein [Myxococcaceae]MBF5043588.1 hypothetical protein [Simulacricoccus sp. 17bor-14]MRI89347.1 hypothetical protein [Aggregicoccus sp. 17bor-14]
MGTLAVVAATLGLAGTAAAQTTTGEGSQTTTQTTTTTQGSDATTYDTTNHAGPDRSGVYVLLGGGIQGYTGDLGDAISVGPEAGVYLGLQPFPLIGLELGYTGGLHNFKTNLRDGPDFIRHGAQAAVTLGAPLGAVKPYALAGIGVDFSTIRSTALTNSNTDTGGFVPLGAGLNFAVGNFDIDARFTYHVLFDKASFNANQETGGGRYQAQLSLGFTL